MIALANHFLNQTTKLGHAYGFCVVLVTFITTCLVALVALIVWRTHWWIVLPIWLIFVTLDGLFLSSAATKFVDGAWFTFVLALILASFFILWRYGKEQQWKCEAKHHLRPQDLLIKDGKGKTTLAEKLGGGDIFTVKGLGIFFDKAGGAKMPAVYEEFIRKFQAQQDVHVFLHLRALQVPHVADEDRFEIAATRQPSCYRVVLRHGYNDHPVNADLGAVVYAKLREAIQSSAFSPAAAAAATATTPIPGNNTNADANADADALASAAVAETAEVSAGDYDPIDIAGHSTGLSYSPVESRDGNWLRPTVSERLAALESAYATQVVYIVGKEQLRLLENKNGLFKRVVLSIFLWFRDNTRAKVAKMNIPVDKLVEVGFVREI